jgi:hypothetical protein
VSNEQNGGNGTNTTTDLPTIHEIRSRLKRKPITLNSIGDNNKIGTKLLTFYKYVITMLFSLISFIIFGFIDLCDYFTGGTGQVNIDNVTIIEGMYTITSPSTNPTTSTTNPTRNNNNNNHSSTAFDDDDEYSGSTIGGGFAASQNIDQEANTMQTHDDVVFELPCHCKVHDICLRGFMLLGKHNICPSCKEISSFDVFVSPWDSLYDNYKQFLETVKYFIAINPLLLFIINIMLYFFW